MDAFLEAFLDKLYKNSHTKITGMEKSCVVYPKKSLMSQTLNPSLSSIINPKPYMSYSLNSLKRLQYGTVIGSVKGDTRSLDYSSYIPIQTPKCPQPASI